MPVRSATRQLSLLLRSSRRFSLRRPSASCLAMSHTYKSAMWVYIGAGDEYVKEVGDERKWQKVIVEVFASTVVLRECSGAEGGGNWGGVENTGKRASQPVEEARGGVGGVVRERKVASVAVGVGRREGGREVARVCVYGWKVERDESGVVVVVRAGGVGGAWGRLVGEERKFVVKARSEKEAEEWARRVGEACKKRVEEGWEVSGRKVGGGAYGKVFLAKRRKGSEREGSPVSVDGRGVMAVPEMVAIKVVAKGKAGSKGRKRLDDELDILRWLGTRTERVVRPIDFYEDAKKVYIVMEYMAGGDLGDRIAKGKMTEREAAKIMQSILKAVQFLHSNNVAHRDIKPENIMFASPGSDEVKLVDFGLSSFSHEQEGQVDEHSFSSQVGTPYYVAPEIWSGKHYGLPVDIFACGVVLYIMLSGSYPFIRADEPAAVYKKKVMYKEVAFPREQWQHISPLAKWLIHSMLKKNPDKRITVDQALQHPWFEVLLSDSTSGAVGDLLSSDNITRILASPSSARSLNTSGSFAGGRGGGQTPSVLSGMIEDDDSDFKLRMQLLKSFDNEMFKASGSSLGFAAIPDPPWFRAEDRPS